LKSSKKDIQKDDYDALLTSFDKCLQNLETYDGDDASYVKLTIFQEVFNFLDTYRNGLARSGVDESTVLSLLDEVHSKSSELFVTAEESIAIQDEIEKNYEGFRDNIETTYQNVAERSN
jgi:hypothetical protein